MKKTLYALLFILTSITTFGQVIPQGTRFIGGDVSFSYGSVQRNGIMQNNAIQLGVAPAYTKFMKDNFSVTYMLGYNVQSIGSKISNGSQFYSAANHTISAGVFLRNYKMISDKFGLSVGYGGNIGYSFNSISGDVLNGSPKVNGVGLNLSAGPGIIYLLNEKLALEGTASLVNLNVSYNWQGDTNAFNVGTNISANPGLGIGFRYFLK